jgi:hypothetical protein
MRENMRALIRAQGIPDSEIQSSTQTDPVRI